MRSSYPTSSVELTAKERIPLTGTPGHRPISQEDRELLYELHKAAMIPYVEATWGWDEGIQREFWIRTAHDRVRVIEWNGELAGYFDVRRHPDHIDIVNIVLGPNVQGRGIGTAIMNGIIAEARQQKMEVRLQVLKANPRAGFRATGETETHILMALPSA